MKPARIEYELDGSKRLVMYESEGVGGIGDSEWPPEVPVLLVEVSDSDDAAALVAAIEKVDRSPPKKERKRKPTSSPAPVADPASPPGDAAGAGREGCEVPGCKYDADHGQKRCREHAGKAA